MSTTYVQPTIRRSAIIVNLRSAWGYVLTETVEGQTRREDGTFGPSDSSSIVTRAYGARFTNLGDAVRGLSTLHKHVDVIQLSAPKPVWDALTRDGYKSNVPLVRLSSDSISADELRQGQTALSQAWLIATHCWEREVIHGDRNDIGEQDKILPWDKLSARVYDMVERRVQAAYAKGGLNAARAVSGEFDPTDFDFEG